MCVKFLLSVPNGRLIRMISFGALLALTACASSPAQPPAGFVSAQDAVLRAQQADAHQYAPAELDEARQQLLAAERAFQSQDLQDAERFASYAQLNAELAVARTAFGKAQSVNRELAQGLEALIEEMQRTGDQP